MADTAAPANPTARAGKPASDPRDTPAMRQHARFKARHPDCLLLFRIGDFYEMFDEDAVRASKAIGLTLTQRTAGVPMAGVPYHQLETYLARLMGAGFRVAVCEQVQDPGEVKSGQVIERAVTRVLTPGTLVDQTLLSDDRPNTLAAVCFPPAWPEAPGAARRGRGARASAPAANGDDQAGVARAAVCIAELSTGHMSVLSCRADALADELARRGVSEVLYAETADHSPPPRVAGVLGALGLSGTPRPQWQFRSGEAREALLQQFGVSTLLAFGLENDDPRAIPAGVIVRYLLATQAPSDADAGADNTSSAGPTGSGRPGPRLAHLRPPRVEQPEDHLLIDAATLRSLELDRTIRGAPGSSGLDGSLLGVFLGEACPTPCRTAMGKRTLRDWLLRPLAALEPIRARHRCVGTLVSDRRQSAQLAGALAGVQDVPRMAARIALERASPRDLVALGQSAGRCAVLRSALGDAPAFKASAQSLERVGEELASLAATIAAACVESPPTHLREGGLIRDGVDPELDEARLLQRDAGTWLSEYSKRLIDEHQIPTMKVGYNKVFGYYIEISKAAAARAPASFSRRQTLTNAERFITPELKEFEDKVTGAQARALLREQHLFDRLCAAARACLAQLHDFSTAAGELDALVCMADKAAARGWVEPRVVDEPALRITQGRHPVLDELLGGDFVPNDLALGVSPEGDTFTPSAARLALITGPNMAGKSTFIRQTALLVILAHAGSFVPAASALIGLTDRVFARVGADDALHAGQSTFMVEMIETAAILHHATARSLVVLDEIGRGTSTLDGLSLAWAITETLADDSGQAAESSRTPKAPARCPRTLFATHYHELTRLADDRPERVVNLHVAVREWTGHDGTQQIVFLHRILPGRADRSYGLHVARLAGIPAHTIARAEQVLESLSVEHSGVVAGTPAPTPQPRGTTVAPPAPSDGQLMLFREYLPHPAVNALRALSLDALTPLQAFDELRRLCQLAQPASQSPANSTSSPAPPPPSP